MRVASRLHCSSGACVGLQSFLSTDACRLLVRRSPLPHACRFKTVFQHSTTQRNSFYATKMVSRTFTQAKTPQRRLRLLAALRKQTETTSIFYATPQANSTNQELSPSAALRNVAVAAQLRCVALRYGLYIRNAGKSALVMRRNET